MSRKKRTIAALLALFVPVLAGGAQRTFVSAASGDDANPCTRSLPCRQFSRALVETDAGGEVVALDSGGYGPFSFGQSATVTAPAGVHAAITAFTGHAVSVPGQPADVFVLRGLYLNGAGGSSGVFITSGSTVHVENCIVSGFNVGIDANGAATAPDVYVKDTISRGNEYGFYFVSSGGELRATLHSIRAESNSGAGVYASVNSEVTVIEGILAGNGSFGGYSFEGVLNLERSTLTGNSWGVHADAGSVVRVSRSMITGNGTGVSSNGDGSSVSFGNNALAGNTTDGAFNSSVPEQ